MKNLRKISIATLVFLAILGTCVLGSTGTVNAPSGLVLRKEASTSGAPITTLPNEAQVNIIEKVGDWYKVTYNSQEGYAFAKYIEEEVDDVVETPTEEPTEGPEEQQPTSQYPKKSTTKNSLSVYNIPLITSTVINQIEANAEVTIYKQITNWSYVSAGDIYGWVRTYGIENEAKETVQEEIPEQTVQPEEPEEVTTPEQEEPENVVEQPADNSSSTETTATVTKAFVNVDFANVRSKASTHSNIVTTLTKNTSFTVLAETEEWYKIKYTAIDGTVYEGYIYKNLTIPANN